MMKTRIIIPVLHAMHAHFFAGDIPSLAFSRDASIALHVLAPTATASYSTPAK
jgi:hypothetical protein